MDPIAKHFTPQAAAKITAVSFEPRRVGSVSISWISDGARFFGIAGIDDDFRITGFLDDKMGRRGQTRRLWLRGARTTLSSVPVPDVVDVQPVLIALRTASGDGRLIREAFEKEADERAQREAEAIQAKSEAVLAAADSLFAEEYAASALALLTPEQRAAFYVVIQNSTA
jgi:hypothetical protein